MSSTKSASLQDREPQTPSRKNGRARVEAILQSAADVIAERGYAAATMAEIGIRSDTRTGSLYRFFPNKESLFSALMRRYQEKIDSVFDSIDAKGVSLSLPELSDMFLYAFLELNREGASVARLLDDQPGGSIKREAFRGNVLRRIARSLKWQLPGLKERQVDDMAFALLHNMKSMVAFSVMKDAEVRAGAIRELRRMNRLYLKNRLKDRQVAP